MLYFRYIMTHYLNTMRLFCIIKIYFILKITEKCVTNELFQNLHFTNATLQTSRKFKDTQYVLDNDIFKSTTIL